MRRFLFVLSLFGASLLLAQPPPRPQRPGVKEAGVLEPSRGDLLELYDALILLNGKPDKIVMRDLTVVPRR